MTHKKRHTYVPPARPAGLHCPAYEPDARSDLLAPHFTFDRRKLSMSEVRELLVWEVLEYHPVARHAALQVGGRRLIQPISSRLSLDVYILTKSCEMC